MKKVILVTAVVLAMLVFAGVAGAAVTETPLELEEGMMGITSVSDEPVESPANETTSAIEDMTVSEEPAEPGVEVQLTIPGMDGQDVVFEGTPEEAQQIRTFGGMENERNLEQT